MKNLKKIKDKNNIYYFFDEKIDYNDLIKKIEDVSQMKTIRKNLKSEIYLFEYKKEKLLLKIPVNKNNRLWIKIVSIFRTSNVLAILLSMEKLNKYNIKTNRPILAMENRKFNMVINSFAVYSYIDGNPIKKRVSYEVYDILKKIHKNDYLHSDPQNDNFIIGQNNELYVIDANLKKTKSKIKKASEMLLFIKEFAMEKELKTETQKTEYRIAKFLKLISEVFKILKRKKKKILSQRR